MFNSNTALFIYILLSTHLTIITVTVYLHRCVAHRSLSMHKGLEHMFRFICWLTTGQNPQQWAAVHRKHHAFCEKPGDPHSPRVYGVWNILFKGVFYYRKEAINPETINKYGKLTPDDWIEHNLYRKYHWLGLVLLFILDVVLFGYKGIIAFLFQIAWIPFWAAGVVNGIGHKWGYKNFTISDDSTNLFPIGLIIGGEELHNNHHANPASAKLSVKWYEFDIGWMYITLFRALGLVKVNRVYQLPKIQHTDNKPKEDEAIIGNILNHRYFVWSTFKQHTKDEFNRQLKSIQHKIAPLDGYKKKQLKEIFYKNSNELHHYEVDILKSLLTNEKLKNIHHYKEHLEDIWLNKEKNMNELIEGFKQWRKQILSENNQSLTRLVSKIEQIT